MVGKKFLMVFLSFLGIFSLLGSSAGVSLVFAPELSSDNSMKFGINYYSTHNHYEPKYLTDYVLDRDFSFFEKQGIKDITVALIWKYLEPSWGEYNDQALDDVERVCSFASKYNLNVTINFYTMMQENSFTIPEWVIPRKFEQVFLDPFIRQAWLNFLDHCVDRLSSVQGISSWHMMNEPARTEWACDVEIDDYIALWSEMKDIFKAHSDRPVSVRFAAQVFDNPNHFNRDSRIYDILDYIALNWYENHCSREKLESMLNEIREYSEVEISEFGFKTNNDQLQAWKYFEYVSFFRRLKITECSAWMWRADYDSPNPEPAGNGFNLAKNFMGQPRQAFYFLQTESYILQYYLPQFLIYYLKDQFPVFSRLLVCFEFS